MKAGFVSVVGRPSAGKSSLVNALCGHKVSIVSPVPQTTRNRIRGILTRAEGQVVFLDTPGYHLSERRMNLRMQEVARASLAESDAVLYVVDPARPAGDEERAAAALVAAAGLPAVVALSKSDLPAAAAGAAAAREFLRSVLPASPLLAVSSVSGDGLASLLEALWGPMPEGEPFYDPDYYTDQTPEFRVAEVIREQAVAVSRQELPHSLYVEIADLEMRSAPAELLWVRAFLVVERASQVGILVGQGGERIRSIRLAAEAACGELFPYPVRIDLRVRARPKWRSSEEILARLIG